MAKAKTVTQKVKEQVIEELLGEQDERELEEQADLDEFFNEVGGGATCVDIFEVLDGAERGYIKRVDWAQLKENPLEMIKKKFGCRKYFLRFRGADRRILRSKIVNIVADTPSVTPGVTPPSPVPNANDSDSKFMRDVLLAFIAKQNPPPAPAAFDMQGLAALMIALKQPTADPASMLAAVSQAFSAVRGSAKEGDGLSMAKTIVELAAAIGGNGNGKDDNLYTVIRDVGKEVVNKLPIGALMPASSVPIDVIPPAPAAAPAERVVSPVVSPVVPPQPAAPAAPRTPPDLRNPETVVELIRVALQYLKQKAAKPDPDGNLFNLAIDWILENSEEPQWAAMLGAIRQGATFEQLLQFDIEIANIPPLREWFKRLYDELHTEIFNAVDTRRARGNANNPASDGPGKPAGSDDPGSTKSSS